MTKTKSRSNVSYTALNSVNINHHDCFYKSIFVYGPLLVEPEELCGVLGPPRNHVTFFSPDVPQNVGSFTIITCPQCNYGSKCIYY